MSIGVKGQEKRESSGGIVGAGAVWRREGTLVVASAALGLPRANRHWLIPSTGDHKGPTPPTSTPAPTDTATTCSVSTSLG